MSVIWLLGRKAILNDIIHILKHSLDLGHHIVQEGATAVIYFFDLAIPL
jgi:hypothetical protein